MIDDRILKIIPKEKLDVIQNLKVLIIGVGGVGGYALESLVRTGIKNITIIDKDKIDESNLNRQIIALKSNINKSKVEEAKKRALDIRNDININAYELFLDKNNLVSTLDENKYDYIIDACDNVTVKLELIKYAQENNIELISSLGTGNRLNPEELKITTLDKTYNDPLGKVLRKLVKDNNLNKKVTVLWSKEIPIKTLDRTPGSLMFVPASAGILIASYIIRKELNK